MNLLRPAQQLRASKTLETALNYVNRITRRGNYWYWLEAPELQNGVNIDALISPLRYDVLVRRDFFAFYAKHRDLYRSDFTAFINRAKQHSYYTWYMESEAVRCEPHLLSNIEALDAKFISRICKSVALYDSIMEHGFTQQHPIILKTAERLLPPTSDRLGPPTGKFVSARYFMADGCHRLALLMAMGYTTLPTGYFRIKCFREFSPFDSTSLLARALPIGPAAYFAFLSSNYCAPQIFEDKDSFLGYIKKKKPEFMPEVLSVIRVDGFDANVSKNDNELAILPVVENLEK